MKATRVAFIVFVLTSITCDAQKGGEEKTILNVVNSFFLHIEKQDTSAMKTIFLKEAFDYYVRADKDTVISGGRPSLTFNFSPDKILTEKIRKGQEKINIHQHLATVWAPYDFWVNGVMHHCGVDAFTLIKTQEGWKIASIGFTVETEGCQGK
jgi:hypothetical protein